MADKAITALRNAVRYTTRAIDYIQPTAKDFDGLGVKADLLQLLKHLLHQLAKAEACEHNSWLAVSAWEERQEEIKDANERIRAIHKLLDQNPKFTISEKARIINWEDA